MFLEIDIKWSKYYLDGCRAEDLLAKGMAASGLYIICEFDASIQSLQGTQDNQGRPRRDHHGGDATPPQKNEISEAEPGTSEVREGIWEKNRQLSNPSTYFFPLFFSKATAALTARRLGRFCMYICPFPRILNISKRRTTGLLPSWWSETFDDNMVFCAPHFFLPFPHHFENSKNSTKLSPGQQFYIFYFTISSLWIFALHDLGPAILT